MPQLLCLGLDLRVPKPMAGLQARKVISEQFLNKPHCLISGDPSIWLRAESGEDAVAFQKLGFKNALWLRIFGQELEATSVKNSIIIALSADSVLSFALEKKYGSGYFGFIGSFEDWRHRGWFFLGFDTLDLQGLISGLNGCGYVSQEKLYLQEAYGSDINQYDLFSSLERASSFAFYRSLRIPIHAPFVPVGIWVHESQIDEIS